MQGGFPTHEDLTNTQKRVLYAPCNSALFRVIPRNSRTIARNSVHGIPIETPNDKLTDWKILFELFKCNRKLFREEKLSPKKGKAKFV